MFPQPSVAVTVKVSDLLQVPVMPPLTATTDATLQLSVTVPAASTAPAAVGNVVGLQPSAIAAVGHEVNTGFTVSSLQV